ncbi:hypothetical protein GQ53DRAFT_852954 [Thozetella sp. PMI_491]|nr:hypothetical protein GQ53DRAFT_852954 [Thozetella sp. PMI_491]
MGADYAIQFLATILFAAAPPKAAYVPPPKQLALVATYAVHPKYTSHPEETDATRLSAQAIQYLRSVLRTVGPVNSRLDVAFAFREAGDDDLDSHEESEPLHCALARRGSIWQRVSNFWEALGWAFHCAVSYPRRWKHWKAWLELMVEVLEADWEERKKLDEANLYRASPSVSTSQSNTAKWLTIESRYIGDRPMKELLRAVMAFSEGDNPTDRGSFNKVFSRELATEKTAEQKEAKLQKIDLENNVFGDYAIQEASSSEDDDMLEPQASRSRKRRRAETNVNEAPDPIQTALEDRVAETIGTRLKLFELLSQAYCHDQAGDMLYDFYVEFGLRIRQLPLEIFRLFIRSSGTPLEDDVYASVLRYIILTLAPKDTFDNEEGISLAMCERLFVSLSARRSSVEDNAKLALVLEAMLQHIIARNPGEQCSSTFRQAVEMGIAARREKTKPKMRGGRLNKESPNEQAARKILERSETNLRALVDLLEDTD